MAANSRSSLSRGAAAQDSPTDDDYDTLVNDSDDDDIVNLPMNCGVSVNSDTDAGNGPPVSLNVCNQTATDSSSSGSDPEPRGRQEALSRLELTKHQSMILRLKEVGVRVSRVLKQHGVWFRFDEVSDNAVLIKPADQTKVDKFKAVLRREIYTQQVDIQEGDLTLVQSFNVPKLQQCMVMDSDQQQLTLIYHKSIHTHIEEGLQQLRNPTRKIPLTTNEVAMYMKQHVEWFSSALNRDMRRTGQANAAINIKVETRAGDPCLKVECNRAQSREAFRKIEESMSSLDKKEKEVSLELGLFLQNAQGQSKLQEMGHQFHCLLGVVTPAERVLLSATRCQHRVMICEGLIAATDSHVTILPLCDGQTAWTPPLKHILDRECLSSDVDKYLSYVGRPPKGWIQSHTRQYGGQGVAKKHQTIVMFVPTLITSNNNEEEFRSSLRATCKAAMRSALEMPNTRLEIALPFKLGNGVDLKASALTLVKAIVESIQERHSPDSEVVVKLFLDTLPPDTDMVLTDLEHALPFRGWAIDTLIHGRARPQQASHTFQGKAMGVVHLFGMTEDTAKAAAEFASLEVPGECREYWRRKAADVEVLGSVAVPNPVPRKAAAAKNVSKVDKAKTADPATGGPSQADQGTATQASIVIQVNPIQKELDLAKFEALKLLMGNEFTDNISAQAAGNKVVITCHGPSAQDLMDKIDTLRHEDVLVGQEAFVKLDKPWDATSEGVAACFIPISDQNKFRVYTFDYNAMANAKQLLHFKLRMVKVTSRSRRRFEGKTDDGGDGSTPRSLGYTAPTQIADFTTKSGIKVSVYKTDITKLPVDAIVNTANEHLAHGGGVAYAISQAAGFALHDEGREYVRAHGPLKVSEVMSTTGGNLPVKAVLHAVGPRWTDYKDKGLCERHLADTVINCLVKADSMNMTSVAIPSINSDIFGVPKDACARGYLYGLQSFDKTSGGKTSLKHIHFVDVNDEMVSEIQHTFRRDWDTELQPPVVQKQPTTSPSRQAPSLADGSLSSKGGSEFTQAPKGTGASAVSAAQTAPSRSRSGAMNVKEKTETERSKLMGNARPAAASVSTDDKCTICQKLPTTPKALTCGHTICTRCIDRWLLQEAVCPKCQLPQGILYGNQPIDGRMKMVLSVLDIPGYQGAGSYIIKYTFPAGRQEEGHPSPGRRYSGTIREAYLPDVPEGRKVLMLLKTAFDRRLTFTFGRSVTDISSTVEGIVWNDIHHKTSIRGGPQGFGYPDEQYLGRVQEELAQKGVTEKDLTDVQKEFIVNPDKFHGRFQNTDFSHHFNQR